ncbi:hypothetical protein HDV63DRAFT_290533 [Trichoderma sp. SZMC 28014]
MKGLHVQYVLVCSAAAATRICFVQARGSGRRPRMTDQQASCQQKHAICAAAVPGPGGAERLIGFRPGALPRGGGGGGRPEA